MDSEEELTVSCVSEIISSFILEVLKNQHGSSKRQTVNTTNREDMSIG